MKTVFQSKIVWLGIISVIIAAVKGLWKVEIDPALGEQIVNLDWSNIATAAVGAATIIARWFFTNVPISTLKNNTTPTDEFSPN